MGKKKTERARQKPELVAGELKIHTGMVSRYARGRVIPNGEIMARLYDALWLEGDPDFNDF